MSRRERNIGSCGETVTYREIPNSKTQIPSTKFQSFDFRRLTFDKNMIIYNVTINITEEIHDAWLLWMNNQHVPEVMATGKFLSARLVRVHVDQPMDTIVFAAQYVCKDKATLEQYYLEDAPKMRQKGLELWGDQALYFRTELEVISEF